jgi:hypothetical protein
METVDTDENDIDDFESQKKRKNTCLLICIILMIVLMLPSTLAFLAIF